MASQNTEEEQGKMSESIISHSEEFKFLRTVRQVISKTLLAFSFLSLMGAMCILGYQSYIWLRTGSWKNITLSSVIDIQSIHWIANPDSWHGVHKTIMLFLDLGLSVNGFIIGVLFIWLEVVGKNWTVT